MTVNGAVLCSRCKTKKISLIFPTWAFLVNHPPGTVIDCKEEWEKIVPGYPEYECGDANSCDLCTESLCGCAITPNYDFCYAGEQTTAYRCDETLYVCWSLIPPQVFGLWDETGNACTNTQRKITDLVYCDNSNIFDVDAGCDLCTAVAASDRTCPNGNPVDETIHITAPSNKGYWAREENHRGKADGDIGFCDYGGESISDGWIVDPPIEYTCPDNNSIRLSEFSAPGECQAAVQYIEPECRTAYTMPQGSESGAVFNVGSYSFPVVFDNNAQQTCDLTVQISVEEPEPPKKGKKKCNTKKEKKPKKEKQNLFKPKKEKRNLVRVRSGPF
jgi:hypothetical protein